MKSQEQINADLQGEIDELNRKINSLVNKNSNISDTKFKDLSFYPDLKVDNLIIKYKETTAASEPAILSNQIILWKDTTNTKYYIKANFNGTSKKIELV